MTDRDTIVTAAERVQQELGSAHTSDKRSGHRPMVETNLLGAMTVTEVFLDRLRATKGRSGDHSVRRGARRPD